MHSILLLGLVVAGLQGLCSGAEKEADCPYRTYAGGEVYPTEWGRINDHSLTYSKAKIGQPAPFWTGSAVTPAGKFQDLNLTDFKGKYLVMLFYPLDFTFVCPTEILAFSDRLAEFRQNNAEVVAISVDSKFTHLAWTKLTRREGGLGKVKLPLLSDITHQISKDYGVYLEKEGHTLRGLFIIDHTGVLRQITMNDLPVGRSVDETIRLIQAFRYTDERGEVCPAGWKPGADTIIPTPEGKKAYFEKANPGN